MTDVAQAREKVVLISRYSSPQGCPAYDGVSIIIDKGISKQERKWQTLICCASLSVLQISRIPQRFGFQFRMWLFLVALTLCRAHLHKVRVDFNDETCTYLLNKGNTNLKLGKGVIFFIIHKPLIHGIQKHPTSC